MLVNVLLANSIPTTLPSGFFPQVWFFLKYYYMSFLRGMGVTFIVSVVGTIFGFVLGIGLALLRKLDHPRNENKFVCFLKKFASGFAYCYIEFFRGTPMMVQAICIFYGVAYIFEVSIPTLLAGFIIVSLNTAAYMAEIIRSGLNSIDQGQIEGSRSLGMNYVQTMFNVILPQAIKNVIPAIGNELVVNIKDTSVLNVISVIDIYYVATMIKGQYFRFNEPFFIAACIYLILTFVTTRILAFIDKKMEIDEKPLPSCN